MSLTTPQNNAVKEVRKTVLMRALTLIQAQHGFLQHEQTNMLEEDALDDAILEYVKRRRRA